MKKKKIVIKIGSKLLTTSEGKLDLNNLRQLCSQISSINHHFDIIIVTSGSIVCGAETTGSSINTVPEKQAAAAIGQILLMKEYQYFFGQSNINIAQLLLTKDSFGDDIKKNNVKNTIDTLLNQGIVPIINENDTVATDEIQFGDNDFLSSNVAILIQAEKYIILTDQDGVYTENPNESTSAVLIEELNHITSELINKSPDTLDTKGRGGIKSKLMAVKLAQQHHIISYIANGRKPHIISDILTHQSGFTCIKPN